MRRPVALAHLALGRAELSRVDGTPAPELVATPRRRRSTRSASRIQRPMRGCAKPRRRSSPAGELGRGATAALAAAPAMPPTSSAPRRSGTRPKPSPAAPASTVAGAPVAVADGTTWHRPHGARGRGPGPAGRGPHQPADRRPGSSSARRPSARTWRTSTPSSACIRGSRPRVAPRQLGVLSPQRAGTGPPPEGSDIGTPLPRVPGRAPTARNRAPCHPAFTRDAERSGGLMSPSSVARLCAAPRSGSSCSSS